MKKYLYIFLLLSTTFFLNAKELTLEEVEKLAMKISSDFDSSLKKQLKKAKRENGIKSMTEFCINDSIKILEALNKKYGSNINIKRISLNNRNEKAKALENEIDILKAFDLIQKSDAYLPKQIVQIVDDNIYKVYTPIDMDKRDCKKCHGIESKVDKESKKRFSQVYKNNKAYGYKSGDVRGAVVVTITK